MWLYRYLLAKNIVKEDEELALYTDSLQEHALSTPSQKHDRTVKQTLSLRDKRRDDT